MPNKRKHLLLLFALMLASFLPSRAQETKITLQTFLKNLETEFAVRFSYVEENIVDKEILLPQQKISLEEALELIEASTGLDVERISGAYFSLSLKTVFNICGVLLDADSNFPVSSATVEAVNTSKTALSNTNGRFALEGIPAKTVIRIRFLGYNTFYTTPEKLANPNCATLYLTPSIETLQEVVVQKFLANGITKTRDGNISLNTQSQGILPGLAEPDVLLSAQALPGVESIDESVSNINIRGGTNDQNLLLWDGIKMYNSGHFFGLISAFNPFITEKVTVIKNGTPAAYTDGVSGTIDIQSYNSVGDGFFGGIGFNLISADGYAHIKLSDKLAVQFSARRSITDYLQTPTYAQYFDRAFQDSKVSTQQDGTLDQDIERDENFYFYDATFKILYDVNPNHKVRVGALYANNLLDYTETLNSGSASETKSSGVRQFNLGVGGTLESIWGSNLKTHLSGYYTRYKLDAENRDLFTDQQLLQTNEVLETGVKAMADYQLGKRLNWLNGYQFYEVGITNIQDVNDPFFFSRIKGVVRNHAVFSEVKYTSGNGNLFLKAGGRLNYIERFNKFILEPRLSLSQKLGRYVAVEVLGEMKNQVTNQIIDLQRDFLGVEKRRWILANNKDIPVTTSRQASLGLNFNRSDFYVGIEGFYKEVDGITTSNQGFQNQGQFQRVTGSYAVKGVEMLINKKARNYSAWASYTYNKNDYTFEGIVPATFPNNLDVRHAVTFAGTYDIKNLKLAVGVNWRTGKPFTEPVEGNEVTQTSTGNFINYQDANSSRLPEYFRADASATYQFRISENTRATLGVAVLNLTSRENLLDIFYRLQSAQSTEVQRVESASLGITPNVSFRVFF